MSDEKKTLGAIIAAGALAGTMLFSFGQATLPDKLAAAGQSAKSVVETADDNTDNEVLSEEEAKKRARQLYKNRLIYKLKNSGLGVLAFIGTVAVRLGLTAVGALLLKLVGSPFSGVLAFVGDVLVNFAVIALLFGLVFKLLNPGKKLKEFFTLKNLFYMFIGALAISVIKLVVTALSIKAYAAAVSIQCVATLLALAWVWYKCFEMKGKMGSVVKSAAYSKAGRFLFVGLASGSVLAAVIKTALRNAEIIAGFSQLVFVFLLCALVAYSGYKLLKPKKTVILLK